MRGSGRVLIGTHPVRVSHPRLDPRRIEVQSAHVNPVISVPSAFDPVSMSCWTGVGEPVHWPLIRFPRSSRKSGGVAGVRVQFGQVVGDEREAGVVPGDLSRSGCARASADCRWRVPLDAGDRRARCESPVRRRRPAADRWRRRPRGLQDCRSSRGAGHEEAHRWTRRLAGDRRRRGRQRRSPPGESGSSV